MKHERRVGDFQIRFKDEKIDKFKSINIKKHKSKHAPLYSSIADREQYKFTTRPEDKEHPLTLIQSRV